MSPRPIGPPPPRPERFVKDAVVNMRRQPGDPFITLDGEPFPYLVDTTRPVTVDALDTNVHLLTVTILVDRSVRIVDHAVPEGDYET